MDTGLKGKSERRRRQSTNTRRFAPKRVRPMRSSVHSHHNFIEGKMRSRFSNNILQTKVQPTSLFFVCKRGIFLNGVQYCTASLHKLAAGRKLATTHLNVSNRQMCGCTGFKSGTVVIINLIIIDHSRMIQGPDSRKVSSLKSKILVSNLRFFLDFSQI